eukprot:580029-Prymnesium_polylepis.1
MDSRNEIALITCRLHAPRGAVLAPKQHEAGLLQPARGRRRLHHETSAHRLLVHACHSTIFGLVDVGDQQ